MGISLPHKAIEVLFFEPHSSTDPQLVSVFHHHLHTTDTHNSTVHTHTHTHTQHSTAQHSTAQHSTAQHSTAQHSTAQHSTAQHSTAQHSTAQHSTAHTHTHTHRTVHKSSIGIHTIQCDTDTHTSIIYHSSECGSHLNLSCSEEQSVLVSTLEVLLAIDRPTVLPSSIKQLHTYPLPWSKLSDTYEPEQTHSLISQGHYQHILHM